MAHAKGQQVYQSTPAVKLDRMEKRGVICLQGADRADGRGRLPGCDC